MVLCQSSGHLTWLLIVVSERWWQPLESRSHTTKYKQTNRRKIYIQYFFFRVFATSNGIFFNFSINVDSWLATSGHDHKHKNTDTPTKCSSIRNKHEIVDFFSFHSLPSFIYIWIGTCNRSHNDSISSNQFLACFFFSFAFVLSSHLWRMVSCIEMVIVTWCHFVTLSHSLNISHCVCLSVCSSVCLRLLFITIVGTRWRFTICFPIGMIMSLIRFRTAPHCRSVKRNKSQQVSFVPKFKSVFGHTLGRLDAISRHMTVKPISNIET